MSGIRRLLFCAGLVLWGGVLQLSAAEKIGQKLFPLLRSAGPEDRFVVWISFTDKGTSGLKKFAPSDLVAPRSLERRRAVLPPDRLVDASDFRVEEAYVRVISERGLTLRQRSKWLNAVSAAGSAEQIAGLAGLPFISEIELVNRLPRAAVRADRESAIPQGPVSPGKTGSRTALDYGPSLPQVSLLKIPEVHNTGNYAQGILIGVFDNGFRLPSHESLDSIDILATYDFVDHKVSVVPNNPASNFGAHGVYTLTALGGNKPGKLIGPAFGATYILARTENDSGETPIEEDNWVAAIEWADSLGVQVTSTSLVYLDFDSPYTSWTWRDMDGRTTKISRAAAMAAKKGIVVVNSAGNDGTKNGQNINTLSAPADADSIIAVGAVTPYGVRASFSSVGPTTSLPQRIKPDIMATGTSVYCASAISPTEYIYQQGTSLSCPLAAGVAALMLKAVPSATPMDVIQALKMTASQSRTPDNRMGWGIINAENAIAYLIDPPPPDQPTEYALGQNYPNPFNPETRIEYFLPSPGTVALRIFDILGREIRTLVNETESAGPHGIAWDGTNSEGTLVASGIYLYRLDATDARGNQTTVSRKMMLVR